MTRGCSRLRWRALAFERCHRASTYSGADGQPLCDEPAISQVRLHGLAAPQAGDRSRFAAQHRPLLVMMQPGTAPPSRPA
jgi:hypothetical protein